MLAEVVGTLPRALSALGGPAELPLTGGGSFLAGFDVGGLAF